jgi:hypothetical protein
LKEESVDGTLLRTVFGRGRLWNCRKTDCVLVMYRRPSGIRSCCASIRTVEGRTRLNTITDYNMYRQSNIEMPLHIAHRIYNYEFRMIATLSSH